MRMGMRMRMRMRILTDHDEQEDDEDEDDVALGEVQGDGRALAHTVLLVPPKLTVPAEINLISVLCVLPRHNVRHVNLSFSIKSIFPHFQLSGFNQGRQTYKKCFFSGQLRVQGGVTPTTTKQKTTFFSINGENSPGSCIMKILFYEVRHLSPNFHEFTGSKTYNIAKKKSPLVQKLEKKNVKIRFRLL